MQRRFAFKRVLLNWLDRLYFYYSRWFPWCDWVFHTSFFIIHRTFKIQISVLASWLFSYYSRRFFEFSRFSWCDWVFRTSSIVHLKYKISALASWLFSFNHKSSKSFFLVFFSEAKTLRFQNGSDQLARSARFLLFSLISMMWLSFSYSILHHPSYI